MVNTLFVNNKLLAAITAKQDRTMEHSPPVKTWEIIINNIVKCYLEKPSNSSLRLNSSMLISA